MKKINVMITGATGMIGEGLLHQCLHHDSVGKVLIVNRNPTGYNHPKLTEIIHKDLSDISGLTGVLAGYDACFFCIGVSAVGKNEAEYTALTYTLTINFASAIAAVNPKMTFCYISGAGTDSTEKGRQMWARVKGKTENDLKKLAFASVYNFRPAGLIPFLPLKPSQTYYQLYKYGKWLLLLARPLFPNYVMDLKTLTSAMINCALTGYSKSILEPKDIRIAAKKR